jgi:hypothetical protein
MGCIRVGNTPATEDRHRGSGRGAPGAGSVDEEEVDVEPRGSAAQRNSLRKKSGSGAMLWHGRSLHSIAAGDVLVRRCGDDDTRAKDGTART